MGNMCRRISNCIYKSYQEHIKNEDIFGIERKFLKFFGYWPEMPVFNLRFLLWISTYIFLKFIPKIIYLRGTFARRNYQQMTLCIEELLVSLSTLLVIINLKLRRGDLASLVNLLENEWKWNGMKIKSMRTETFKRCLKMKIFLSSFLSITVVLSVLIPFLIFVLKYHVLGREVDQKFMVSYVDYGFNWMDTWFYYFYEVTLIPFCVSEALSFAGFTIFQISLIMYCTSNFTIVSKMIKDLECEKRIMKSRKVLKMFLRNVVQSHARALKMAEHLDSGLGDYMLVLHVIQTFMMCFLSFVISITQNNEVLSMKIISLFVFNLFAWFWYYHLAQKLMDESSEITTAIQELSWYHPELRCTIKYLNLITLMSQKNVGIKIGRCSYVNYERFLEAVNTAYSYFTILQTLIGNKK